MKVKETCPCAPHVLATLLLVSAPGVADDRIDVPNIVTFPNADGLAATYTTAGSIDLNNPFFQSLGTNGRACVSCHQPSEDIGRFKGPILRALATRAPYFHNGSANNFDAVLDFYNKRFAIGLTDDEVDDLVAFLGTL